MKPLSVNQRPDLLTSLINMSLVPRLPREIHLCRSSSNVPRLPSFLEMLQNPHILLTFDKVHNHLHLPRESPKMLRTHRFLHFWLRNVLRAATACTFSTSQLAKVLRTRQFFTLLTSKCASRHNGVHFRHLNFQKWSNIGAFNILTSKCASRHNGVQFFISHLPSGLRTRRFSEPTFRPSGATNVWKTQCFATFLPFRVPGSSFFWLFLFLLLFSSLTLPISAFHLSILSEVWLLNFLRQGEASW